MNTQRQGKDVIAREKVDRLGQVDIGMLDREIARHERGEAYGRLLLTALASLLSVVAAIVIATNLWVAVLQVSGSSMSPLLRTDEIVFVARTKSPAKNDIIAFNYKNKLHIKRVIASAGDWVAIDADGTVSVNGSKLDEPYVSERSLNNCDIQFPYHVSPGTVFALGDNRPSSMDSRDSEFGPVSTEQIVGKVKFRAWPLARLGSIK